MSPSRNLFFSVGEPSGDEHAARLIEKISQIQPNITIRGFGGPAMRESGCQVDLDLTQHAVMGILEVLPKLRQFFRFVDQAEEVFRSGTVDAVVLVDFPGFNWHIAKRAKRYGIPVYYYCPPQLWAWGGWRVRKMRRTVDHVLAVLPIEQKYFSDHGIPTTYVGHPFFDAVRAKQLDSLLMKRLAEKSAAGAPLVAVLPGSRGSEVHRNWPVMLAAIRRVAKQHPTAKFLVAAYRDSQCVWCRDQLTDQDHALPISFHVGKTSEIIDAARCAMMVSGSVSLELMARKTPAAVIYRVGRVFHTIIQCTVGVDSMTLPNLMGPRKVFPEMLSVGNPEPAIDFLSNTIDAMLGDEFYYRRTLAELDALSQIHARGGGIERAATWICEHVLPSENVADTPAKPVFRRAA